MNVVPCNENVLADWLPLYWTSIGTTRSLFELKLCPERHRVPCVSCQPDIVAVASRALEMAEDTQMFATQTLTLSNVIFHR